MVFLSFRERLWSIPRANRDLILSLEKNEGDLKCFYHLGAHEFFSSESHF